MSRLLIVTEDVVKIQILTGNFGKLFSLIYINYLKLRITLTVFLLKPFHQIAILTSDCFKLKNTKTLYYGQELANINYADNRKFYQEVVDDLLKDIPTDLFKTRLAIFLVYNYFIYADLYQKVFKYNKFDRIIVLGNSYHEQTACFVARQQKLKSINVSFLSFSWLHQRLKHFLLNREYGQKITNFLFQAKNTSSIINQPVLLSLDFYRHLKTLAPIYNQLEKENKNPYFISDITNLNQSLENLSLSQARAVYLANFLPKPYTLINPIKLIKRLQLSSKTDLKSFLHNLSLQIAKPIIYQCLIIQDLYLTAGKQLFNQTNPKGIAVVSDVRFNELTLSLLAKKHQIKSIMISPNTLLAHDELNPYSSTDKVTVVGDYIKEKLINLGLNSQKIHVVGDPRIGEDQTIKTKLNKKEVCKKLNIHSTSKIALLISFRSTWMIPKTEKKAFFKMAVKAVSRQKNTILVIKPHPTEKRYRILEELKEWSIDNVVVAKNNQLELIDLLSACSVVLQTWSMTIFEAIIMNRPVIVINPENKDYNSFIPIIKPGGAVEVKTQAQLDHWLPILLNQNSIRTKKQLQKAKMACAKFIKSSDGKIAQRITSLLFS